MLVLEDKIFLHFQKCAGLSVYELVNKLKLKKLWFKEHCGIVNLPEEYEHMRRFAFIRNPYDWYVSYYHFQLYEHTGSVKYWINPFFSALTKGCSIGFSEFVRNSVNLKTYFENNMEQYQVCIGVFEYAISRGSASWVGSWFKDPDEFRKYIALDELNMSLMEWYMKIIGLNESNTTVYKLEEFNSSLIKEFGSIEFIPHVHTSMHKKYSCYYNNELINVVNRSHDNILDKYNYKF